MCPFGVRLSRGGLLLVAWLLVGCGEEFEPTPGSSGSCNRPGALSDTFDDGELSDAFRTRTYGDGMVIEESGGMLVFAPGDTGGSGSREARYAVDLRGSFVVVEVPEVSEGLKGKSISVSLTQSSPLSVSMAANEDSQNPGSEVLRFDVTTKEGSTKSSTPYDPVAHRWWRLGESGGVLSFGASPDGANWTTFHEVPAPPFIEAGYLTLSTNDSAKLLPIGQIRFDNLNPQGGSFCGVDQLHETFDQDLGEGWSKYEDTECQSAVIGGAFETTLPTGSVGQCSITTRHGYDLRGRAITVAFGAMPTEASGTGVSFSLTSGDDDRLTLEQRQGTLTATSVLGAVTSTGSIDLAEGPAFWRIREAAGRIEFEVSTDGTSFESVHSVIVDSLPARFLASLRFYVNSARPESATVVVDAIN